MASGSLATARCLDRLDDCAVALLGCLRGCAENGADLLPRRTCSASDDDSVDDLLFAAGSGQGGTLQEVLLDRTLVGARER